MRLWRQTLRRLRGGASIHMSLTPTPPMCQGQTFASRRRGHGSRACVGGGGEKRGCTRGWHWESLWSPEVHWSKVEGWPCQAATRASRNQGGLPTAPSAIRRSALGVLRSTPGGTKLERPLRLKGQQNGEGTRVNGGKGRVVTGSTKSKR